MLAAAAMLTGCTMYSNAKILAEDDAKIAITINKDYSGTLINANTGERITPCIADISKEDSKLNELIRKCYPEGHDPNGKIITSGQFTLREGSFCYTAVVGNSLYVFCQPPLNLGF